MEDIKECLTLLKSARFIFNKMGPFQKTQEILLLENKIDNFVKTIENKMDIDEVSKMFSVRDIIMKYPDKEEFG